jgi:NADH-quinone oxidoreductase subunit J
MNPETASTLTSLLQGGNIAFWLITAAVILSACGAALSRSIVQAAFCLFFTLVGMAGYFVLLGSGFLAITQIVVYVGGILVLLMFGILLTNRPLQRDQAGGGKLYAISGVIGVALLGVLMRLIVTVPWPTQNPVEPVSDVRPIGRLLLSHYLLPFEVVGVTLLLCLIGAAYLVRREDR